MKIIKINLIALLISFLFVGCSGNQIKYDNLNTCEVDLLIDETSSLSTEFHKIYKITIPAKTSIRLRSLFIRSSGLSKVKVEPVFSENEFILVGSPLTTQLISITGNNKIYKKVTLISGEDSYGSSEDEAIKLENFLLKYDIKDTEVQKTGKIDKNDIFIETNENAKFINYPYIGTSAGINFYLANDTNVPQEIYYNIFIKDTSLDVGKNFISYLIEGFFGESSSSNTNEVVKEKEINYGELFKLVSTALKEDETKYKIKEMERYYAKEYIKTKVEEVIESNFGELPNGQEKIMNHLMITAIDIYFYSDSDFFIN